MAVKNLNSMMSEVKKSNAEIDAKLKIFLAKYDGLYQEANRQLHQERTATGSMKGLEDFQFMVQTIKRNKDVVGSLLRGVANIRSLKSFTIIEEDVPDRPIKKKTNQTKKKTVAVPELVSTGLEEGING